MYLRKQGYKLLGQGVDQMAFADPNHPDQVLKIFGYQHNKLSSDQKMLYTWAKFCQENSNNPYLPKFYGIETFIFKGKHYLQFRQEKLYKNRKFNEETIQSIVGAVDEHRSFKKWMKTIRQLATYRNYGPYKQLAPMFKDTEQIKQLKGFYDTVKALDKIADKKDWTFDLHEGNIMMRSDTTPVISDPWVISGYRSY